MPMSQPAAIVEVQPPWATFISSVMAFSGVGVSGWREASLYKHCHTCTIHNLRIAGIPIGVRSSHKELLPRDLGWFVVQEVR